jgi:hypothetical protein
MMKELKYFFLTLLGLLIGGGCATTTFTPFRVPQEEFHAKARVIALMPAVIYVDIPGSDLIGAKFDSLVETTLRDSGLTLVSAREVETVWKSMSDRLGGVMMPETGKRDESKYKAAREHTLRELGAKFNVEAILYPSIATYKVRWEEGVAGWHGVAESVIDEDLSFWQRMWMGHRRGTVSALSFSVVIADIHGFKLYENVGGIQVSAKLVKTSYDFEPVPQEKLLTDDAKNLKAVQIALDPLRTRKRHGDTPGK